MTLCDAVNDFRGKVSPGSRETRYCNFAPPEETAGFIDLSAQGDGSRGIAFLTDRMVIRLGTEYLGWMVLFYFLPAMTNGVQCFFRGMGRMKTTMLATFLQASTRTVCTYLLAPIFGITGIAFSCAIGWSLMLLCEVPYYFITCKKMNLKKSSG